MATSLSLKTLLDLARNRSDQAARQLVKLNCEEQKAEEKLKLLLEFRRDYESRLQQSASDGIDQMEWNNYHAFMGHLDNAITEQSRALAVSRKSTDAGRTEWRLRQRAVKSYDALSQIYARADHLRSARSEQREQDEQALKSVVHKPPSMERE